MNKFNLWLNYDRYVFISRNDFIKIWPFTINAGILARRKNEVLFIVADKVYAINGRARMNKKYIDFTEVIWKDDIDVSWIIKKGLSL